MAFVGGRLYVANTDGLVSFPYQPGQERIDAAPIKPMTLPAGGYNNHWTRNLRLSLDGKTLFVSVGSASNLGSAAGYSWMRASWPSALSGRRASSSRSAPRSTPRPDAICSGVPTSQP